MAAKRTAAQKRSSRSTKQPRKPEELWAAYPLAGRLSVNQQRFLRAYLAWPEVSAAAAASGVARSRHYAWMATSAVYREAFSSVREAAIDRLYCEAYQRALDRADRASAFLLRFLLEASGRMPARRLEISGPDGGPLRAEIGVLSDEELERELERTERLLVDTACVDGQASAVVEGEAHS